jgi:hypothetical protein
VDPCSTAVRPRILENFASLKLQKHIKKLSLVLFFNTQLLHCNPNNPTWLTYFRVHSVSTTCSTYFEVSLRKYHQSLAWTGSLQQTHHLHHHICSKHHHKNTKMHYML